MATAYQKRAVGIFATQSEAERALRDVKDSGFPMDRVSVIAKDKNRPVSDDLHGGDEGNKADEGAAVGAATGGTIGTITGLLVGLGVLAIPGIGPIMLAGATATAVATTAGGAAIGAATGGLIGALVGLGIPEERAKVYKERVAQGDYLVIVDGTEADITRAGKILKRGGIEEWGVYDAPENHDNRDNRDNRGNHDVNNQANGVRRQKTIAEDRTSMLEQEQEQELARARAREQELTRARTREQEQGQELTRARAGKQEQEVARKQEQELARAREQEQGQELARARAGEQEQELARKQEQKLAQAREQKYEQELARARAGEQEQELARKQEQKLAQAREQELARARDANRTDGDVLYEDSVVKVVDYTRDRDSRR
ncbi:general stress protein [Geitlerinema sp. P-1104]|uniref:general stress protein n=1 Tax=Geitlerinema sp. P-1104 TaxID=2546230 RepID=UPI00197D74E1|nr:general stress protein [Geitlerinema sp. P-1104]